MFQTINRSRSTVNASRVAKKLHLSILLSPLLLLLLLLLLLFSKFRAQSLHGQQDAGFTIKIITYNRLHSLQRLVSSISRARYEGPVDIDFHVEGGAPLELQKYVNSLSWSHGDARVHNRVVKGGLIQAVVESWEPVDQEAAAIFLEELCVTILRGTRDQLRSSGQMKDGEVGIHEVEHSGEDEINAFLAQQSTEPLGAESPILAAWQGGRDFVDDLTGLPLPPELCRAARRKEIDYLK